MPCKCQFNRNSLNASFLVEQGNAEHRRVLCDVILQEINSRDQNASLINSRAPNPSLDHRPPPCPSTRPSSSRSHSFQPCAPSPSTRYLHATASAPQLQASAVRQPGGPYLLLQVVVQAPSQNAPCLKSWAHRYSRWDPVSTRIIPLRVRPDTYGRECRERGRRSLWSLQRKSVAQPHRRHQLD